MKEGYASQKVQKFLVQYRKKRDFDPKPGLKGCTEKVSSSLQ